MKIETIISDKGVERRIDFQGATLPNGRSIEVILNENEKLKKDVFNLEKDLQKSSSILTKWIPNRKIRIIVEVILILGTIIGIIQIIYQEF